MKLPPLCLFLLRYGQSSEDDGIVSRLVEAGASQVRTYKPLPGRVDPYLAPEADAPVLVLQAFFEEVLTLESALASAGPLRGLVADTKDGRWAWQAMASRFYPVADSNAWVHATAGVGFCAYLVGYVGKGQDDARWLGHYISHHPPIMARLPGLRALELYSRLDVACGVPLMREDALQRNLTVFDTPDALVAAMASEVRVALREDYRAFPPFEGTSPHVAMSLRIESA